MHRIPKFQPGGGQPDALWVIHIIWRLISLQVTTIIIIRVILIIRFPIVTGAYLGTWFQGHVHALLAMQT